MEYDVRFAKQADCESIVEYIDCNWKKDHILVRNKNLFHWQYDGDGDGLNFVLGISKEGYILGLLGYIKYGNDSDSDICLALWKANEGSGILGIELLTYLMDNEPHRTIMCTGINLKTTAKIYNFLGLKVKEMVQWYRLNNRKDYKIAAIYDRVVLQKTESRTFSRFERVWTYDELPKSIDNDKSVIPYKSRKYLKHRYFNHPEYEYMLYMYTDGYQTNDSLIVALRIQEYDGARVLRIVDGIGNWTLIKNATSYIDSLVEQYDCEYVDLYEFGLEEGLLKDSGWCRVGEDSNIIPNYFSPFERRNVKIYCTTSEDNAILLKGDGDQDRPN